MTTGLRIQDVTPLQTRRRKSQPQLPIQSQTRTTGASSQEEYTESESEDDHGLGSSAEQISSIARVAPVVIQRADLDTSSDDENSTTLGKAAPFTPQPNAFSHPPAQTRTQYTDDSYFPLAPVEPTRSQPVRYRRSYPERSNVPTGHDSHSPYNAYSADHRIDHDEALRASLNTLLSAARALPVKGGPGTQHSAQTGFSGFRVVTTPDRGDAKMRSSYLAPVSPNSSRPRSSSPSVASPVLDDARPENQAKRKTVSRRPSSPQPRPVKKKRTATTVEDATISPTLVTWVISAGVVILVSVVSAGAGYVYGREVGFDEGLQSASCGRALVRSSGELKRFRWGGNSSLTV